MNLFGRKKEEEFEDDDDLLREEELENKKLRRRLKDLSPENSKKRKEPPKPWGKTERIIVLIVFVLTTLSATVMFLISHEFKFPGLPKITFKSINVTNPFKEEIIEIGQKTRNEPNDSKARAVISKFNSEIKPLSGAYGLYVIRLEDGASYGVSSDSLFQGASVIKLPLMVLAYVMNEEGKLDLTKEYTLKAEDKVKGSGVLYNASVGSTYSYLELLRLMGHDSDRTAYKVMKGVVGEDNIKDFLNSIGMTSTNITTGYTSPEDIAHLLQKVWNLDLINQEDRDELLSSLTDTIYESWIPKGVPNNVIIAHKVGQDEGVVVDAGIVKTDNPYIIVIMGQGINVNDANILFPKISRNVYEVENDIQ